MSFRTCFWDFPQKLHLSRSAPSALRATVTTFRQDAWPQLYRSCFMYLNSFHTSLTRAPSNVIRCSGRETERARAIDAARTRSPELPVPRPGSVRVLARSEHLIDETVLLGLLGREEEVPLDVVRDLRGLLVRVLGQSLLQPFAHPQHLCGLDLEVGGLSLPLPLHGRLVDEHTRIRQGQALARSAGGQQHGGCRGGLPEADGLDLRLDVLQRVVDRGHRRERT